VKYFFAWLLAAGFLSGSADPALAAVPAIDYEQPSLLTGVIYSGQEARDQRRRLFTFRRTSTRAGAEVRALREYRLPEGTLAARERVAYTNGRLASFEMDELQAGFRGSVAVVAEGGGQPRLVFKWARAPDAKAETKSEPLRKDVLVNDMIPGFISLHWDELMRGRAINFRFVVLARLETIGFRLVKESEGTNSGKPVVVMRMEPTSFIIARLVNPVRFTVEKTGQRRILQYVGRTTPMIKRGNKWEDLDALTVFDWKNE
jgi:hypothetical protein